ncbi:hypothetical protein B9Z19DRAFT_1102996 [Tuber borchii]|uniref:DUF1479 domain protein n=1 Tax=Tuber borchii TaxID=42251 RepID=A0A2T6ZIK3_TUBBO|nr:hypothetical protein B9Z19DRAFT_1102996 [Tuber borchii]
MIWSWRILWEGDISSVFPSLSGIAPPLLPGWYAELKRLFAAGRERVLAESWERLLLDLERETAGVKRLGSDIFEFKDLVSLSKAKIKDIKKRGVVVIKNVLPEKEALSMKESLKEHIKRNSWAKVVAFPADSPAVYELYWSPWQRAARAYPSLIASQCFINSLWYSSLTPSIVDTSVSLPYADRFRICQPGDAGFALGARIDRGSVERWEDLDADHRDGAGSCGVWRSCQGWLSMSTTPPGEGTLLEFNNSTHPHLRLDDVMTHVPRISPGDYVFWNCDTIHSVDRSVLYIPAVPWTVESQAYVERQNEAERRGGLPGGFSRSTTPVYHSLAFPQTLYLPS